MGHIELRDLDDHDLDAVFEMTTDADAVALAAFTADDPTDRAAFDAWIARERASRSVALHAVTDDGAFVGIAATFAVGDDREATVWIAHEAWGRGVATEALRLLVAGEPERPLFARLAAHDAAAIAAFEHNGFTEVSRSLQFAPGLGHEVEVEEIVFALMPALDGA
ncbi:GNAT family N-acetyltransferase [Microbacterium fluvii]|uniref:GNAT family N-acetyltransferase n=1 Tax=Microbacterium fluvii TaxID=415215 RepID=A0ABW2HI11_9MICO|nr:GNAT family N-acetyltransferase [Microbacterium fluvii]MCU4673771.1 GNAT family N-acetyltransferase [Microbacterium fluvii]